MALITQNPFLFSTKLSQSRGFLHSFHKRVSFSSSFLSVRCFSAVSQKPLRLVNKPYINWFFLLFFFPDLMFCLELDLYSDMLFLVLDLLDCLWFGICCKYPQFPTLSLHIVIAYGVLLALY